MRLVAVVRAHRVCGNGARARATGKGGHLQSFSRDERGYQAPGQEPVIRNPLLDWWV